MIYRKPLTNRIANNLSPLGGIAALYVWDNNIFQGFHPPAGVDRQGCIDAILYKYGDAPLIRSQPDFLTYYIGAWSSKNAGVWQKLYETTTLEYNPIHNYDRTETYTEKREGTNTLDRQYQDGTVRGGKEDNTLDSESNGTAEDTGSNISNTTTNRTGDTESDTVNQVSAENSESWLNDTKSTGTENTTIKDIVDGTVDSTATGKTSNTVNESRNRSWDDSENRTGTSGDNGSYNDTITHTLTANGNIGVTTTQDMIKAQREIVQFTMEDFIARSFYEEFCIEIW